MDKDGGVGVVRRRCFSKVWQRMWRKKVGVDEGGGPREGRLGTVFICEEGKFNFEHVKHEMAER